MLRKILVALVATATLLVAAPAGATDNNDSTIYWEITAPCAGQNPFSCGVQHFMQYDSGSIVPVQCETWYQVDTYKYGHPFGTTVFTLGSPAEDAQWIKSWRFVYGGDCVPVSGDAEATTWLCTAPGEVTVTVTTTHWTQRTPREDRVFGEPHVATHVEKDATCDVPDAPNPPDAPHPTPVPATPQFTG